MNIWFSRTPLPLLFVCSWKRIVYPCLVSCVSCGYPCAIGSTTVDLPVLRSRLVWRFLCSRGSRDPYALGVPVILMFSGFPWSLSWKKLAQERALFLPVAGLRAEDMSSNELRIAALQKRCEGQLEEALRDADEACELDAHVSDDFFARALIKKDLCDLVDALRDADRACELDPECSMNFIARAEIKMQLPGQLKEALEDADRACELDPQYDYNFLVRAQIKRSLHPDQLTEALRDAERACELDPGYDANFGLRDEIDRHLWKHIVIVGADPIGFLLALGLARQRPSLLSITLVERRVTQSEDGRWSFLGPRQDQVLTLQDNIVEHFDKNDIDASSKIFNGDCVWPRSKDCAIKELEDRLLQRFHEESQTRKCMQLVAPASYDCKRWREYLLDLDGDIIVAADGAESSTRHILEARPAGFNRILLRDNPGKEGQLPCIDCDYTLGVGLLAVSCSEGTGEQWMAIAVASPYECASGWGKQVVANRGC